MNPWNNDVSRWFARSADHSFPSGHVATAVVAYGGLFVLTATYVVAARRWALRLLVLPVVVLLARVSSAR